MRELSSTLTRRSNAFLVDAVRELRQAYGKRFRSLDSSTHALTIAIEWLAMRNVKQAEEYIRGDKKRDDYFKKSDIQFVDRVRDVCINSFDADTSILPNGWDTHFKDIGISDSSSSFIPYPVIKESDEGSIGAALVWSEYNQYMNKQYRMTCLILEDLIRDEPMLRHLSEVLQHVSNFVRVQKNELSRTHMQLILLEGNASSIQALRESILAEVARPNLSISHFYSDPNQSSGSISAERRFRDECRQYVQTSCHPNVSSGTFTLDSLGL